MVGDPAERTRALPSVYHANAQLYADRDVTKAQRRLVQTIEAVLHAKEQPAYLVAACRVGDRKGLYARDAYNRATFRLRALRAGLEIADDPYVRMTPSGEFECEGWEPFRPEFVVVTSIRGPRGREAENINKGAFLTFLFGILRVGDMGMVELHHLVSTIKNAEVVDEDDPARLVEVLRVPSSQ